MTEAVTVSIYAHALVLEDADQRDNEKRTEGLRLRQINHQGLIWRRRHSALQDGKQVVLKRVRVVRRRVRPIAEHFDEETDTQVDVAQLLRALVPLREQGM